MEEVHDFPPWTTLANEVPIQSHAAESTSGKEFPVALAKYNEVVNDCNLFMQTLERLHQLMGTKFMIPTVGGKELNLHKLFVEVTCRGGIEKVVGDRRWKEVINSFCFPSTATNASFVLRRYYISLLSNYEKLYYQNKELDASLPAAPAMVPTMNQVYTSSDVQSTGLKRSITDAEVNSRVFGVIDGKTKDAYLITVRVGMKILRGVVYHVGESSTFPTYTFASTKYADPVGRRKKRRKLSKLDPTHPKPNRSGYNFFFAEQHAKLKLIHSGKDREISKMIGELWNNLTEEEKAVYQEIGAKDRERYRREMVVYRQRQNGERPVIISNAVPIQQIPAGITVPTANEDPKMEDVNELSPTFHVGNSSESDLETWETPEAEMDVDKANSLHELNNNPDTSTPAAVGVTMEIAGPNIVADATNGGPL